MVGALRGRHTQFYIDILYGLAFAGGFGYLLGFGMDPLVAAFMGGLVMGYFLRVWENMSVYERILREEVASRAESHVAEELEEQVPDRVEEEVVTETQAQVSDVMDSQIPEKVEQEVSTEAKEQVADEVDAQISHEKEQELVDEVEEILIERMHDLDEELADALHEQLNEENPGPSS